MAYGFIPETGNSLRSLAASAFIVSSGPSDATRSRLNDKRMDRPYSCSSATSPITITVDLGASQVPNTAAVLNHNLAFIGAGPRALTVSAADDAAFTIGVVSCATAALDASTSRPKDTCLSWAPVAKRYWRFGFSWTGGGAALLKVGELFLGVATVLTRGELDGSGETERDAAPIVQLANGGTAAIYLAGPVLERSLLFADFTEAQNATLRQLWRDCRGPVIPLLWCEDFVTPATPAFPTAAQQKCVYGHLQMQEYEWTWAEWQNIKPPGFVIRSQGRETGA